LQDFVFRNTLQVVYNGNLRFFFINLDALLLNLRLTCKSQLGNTFLIVMTKKAN